MVIVTTDGSHHESAKVRYARGHAQLPLGETELRTKFIDCLGYGGYEGDAAALFERINTLERSSTPL